MPPLTNNKEHTWWVMAKPSWSQMIGEVVVFENICFPQEGVYISYSLMGQETEKQKLSDLFPSHHLWLMPSGEIYDRSANNSLTSRKLRQNR